MSEFIQKLLPSYVPEHARDKGELFILRERILQALLLILALFGIPPVVTGTYHSIQAGTLFLTWVYITLYVLVIPIIVFRQLSYALRARVIVYIIYALAVSEIFESGLLGEVRMFLVAFIALTAVLFDYKNIIGAILLSLATIAGIGIYISSSPEVPIPVMKNLLMGTDWVTSTSVFILISTAVSGSISIIISGLEANLQKRVELTQSLAYERDSLEDRIHERTRSMSRRMVQLRAASEIARTISELGEPEGMLNRVVELMQERFDLYYVGLFLLDQSKQNAVLRAGSGEAGKRMLLDGHQLIVGGSSMIGWCILNRKARIALDVGAEAVRFNNPHLPLTRSEIALPITLRDQVLGALSIQSEKPNAFDENDVAVLQSIADSLSIALENDRLYNETRQSLEEIRSLNRAYLQQAWAEAMATYGDLSYDYENPLITDSSEPANVIQVPLVLRNEVIGHVALEMDQPNLSSDDATFVDNVTTQTAIALENARLLHETERRAIQEQKLNELASRFSRALSVDEILRAATQELGQLPAVAEVSIQLNPNNASLKTQPKRAAGGNGNGKEHA